MRGTAHFKPVCSRVSCIASEVASVRTVSIGAGGGGCGQTSRDERSSDTRTQIALAWNL